MDINLIGSIHWHTPHRPDIERRREFRGDKGVSRYRSL
jgi:hypothetical protein